MGFLIDMIDVGQGDSLLLSLSTANGDNEVIFLIDAGPPSQGVTVANYVSKYANGHIDVLIGTHLDIDHIGGLAHVLKTCSIGSLYLNLPSDARKSLNTLLRQRLQEHKKSGPAWDMLQKSLEAVDDLSNVLREKVIVPKPLLAGMYWNLGDILVTVLNPPQNRLDAAWAELEGEENQITVLSREIAKALGEKVAPETTAENNASVVIELVYKGQPYALLAADAGADVLREVTAGKRYPFLKVPHHGSKTGMDEALAEQLKAQTCYLPVGENDYGHPAIEVLDMLRVYGKTYCSQRTRDCRRDCPATGFGSLSHKMDREFRPGYRAVDPAQCANNR